MICNFSKKISKVLKKSYKNFETEEQFVNDVAPALILKSGTLNEFDALSIAFNDKTSSEYSNTFENFINSEFKTDLLEAVSRYSALVTKDDNYDYSIEGLYFVLDPMIKENFPILNSFKGDFLIRTELFKDAEFQNELQLLFDKILGEKLNSLEGKSVNEDGVYIDDNTVTDIDLSERIDQQYSDDITDKIDKETDAKEKRKDFEVINEDVFVKVFFNNASEIYRDEFDPYIKTIFRKTMFGDTIDYQREKTVFADLDEDMNYNVLSTLNQLNIKYKLNLDLNSRLVNETDAEYINRISELIKEGVYSYFVNNVNNDPLNINVAFLTPEDRIKYFDLIFTQNLYSVVNNNLGFVTLSKDDDGNVIYKLNSIVKNKRTNFNDAKNGTTQNSEFIKSVISSTKRLISIEKFTDEELIDIFPSDLLQQYKAFTQEGTTFREFLLSRDIKFVMDHSKPFITYNEYNALSIDEQLLISKGLVEDTVSFIANKNDDIANSIHASFFSEQPVVFYNKFTGRVEKQYSMMHLMSEVKYHSVLENDGVYSFEGKHDSYMQKIIIALTSDFNSREERVKLEPTTGLPKRYLNKNIEYETTAKLSNSLLEKIGSDKIDPSLMGKVYLEEEVRVDDNNVKSKRILLVIKQGKTSDDIIKIPLKSRTKDELITQDFIEKKALLVEVDRDILDSNFTQLGDNLILKTSVASKLLEALNFPKDLAGRLNSYLGIGIDKSGKDDSIHDLTNFIANLATVIYLNDDGSDDTIFSEYLGIDTNIIKTTDNPKKITDLEFDPYTLLWKARTSISEEEAKLSGVSGDTMIRTTDGGRTNSIASRTNENPKKLIHELRQMKGLAFRNNAIAEGEFDVVDKVFITGVDDYVNDKTVPLKQMSLSDRYKMQTEVYFLKNAVSKEGNIAVRLFANDRTLPVVYLFKAKKTSNYKAIPLDEKGMLDEGLLRSKLKEVKKKSINDAQNIVLDTYFNLFSPENTNLIDKILSLDKSKIRPEIEKELMVFQDSLKAIIDSSNHNKVRSLSNLLAVSNFNVDLLNIIEGLYPGLYYNPKNGLINEGFILEVDLWNDRITSDFYNDEDIISLDAFIDDIMSKRALALGKSNYLKLNKSTINTLENYRALDSSSHKKLNEKNAFDMLNKAEHYNFLIFDELMNPIRIGDLFTFQKGINILGKAKKELEGRNGNVFVKAYLNERAEAFGARSKRDSVPSSMGLKLALSENPATPVMRQHELEFSFEEDTEIINTLGSQVNSKEITNDGLQFITRVAMIMRGISLSSDFRYDIKDGVIKDLNYEVNLEKRYASLDKKATHTMMATNQLSDAQYDIQRRLFENILLSEDGSEVDVLVPNVELTKEGKINVLSKGSYLKFRTAQNIMDYLGGTLNENVDEDFVKVLLLEENFNIRGKYPAVISFEHTKKIGSSILNSSQSLKDKNGKLYYNKRDMTNNITILDLNKDVNEEHDVTTAMQQMYASLTGVVNKADGVGLFKAISTLYSTTYFKKVIDLQNTINNIITNPDTYLTGERLLNKDVYVKHFVNIYNDLSDMINNNTNPMEAVMELEQRYEALQDGSLDAFIILLKSTVVDNLKESISTQSNSDAIQEALNNGANIDGIMNALYQSHIRTLGAKSLMLKTNGIDNVATRIDDWIKIYKDRKGNSVTKSTLYNSSEKVEIKSKKSTTVLLNKIFNDDIESKVRKAKMTLVNLGFKEKSSNISFIENNRNEIQSALLLNGVYISDDYLVIDKDFVAKTSDGEDVYNKIISFINLEGDNRNVIIFDKNDFFEDDVDLILSEDLSKINSEGYEYKDKTINLSEDNVVNALMQKMWENGDLEYKC